MHHSNLHQTFAPLALFFSVSICNTIRDLIRTQARNPQYICSSDPVLGDSGSDPVQRFRRSFSRSACDCISAMRVVRVAPAAANRNSLICGVNSCRTASLVEKQTTQ
jgi:hypothetical protein